MTNRRAAHLARLAELAEAKHQLAAATTGPTSSQQAAQPGQANPHTTQPQPATNPQPRRAGRVMTDREAALRSYGTRADPRHVAPIFDIAVETILTIPKFAASSDKHLFRILLLFGAWTYQREGFFDPATHLDDARIDYFVEQGLPFRNNASKSTSVSALRRIRQHLDTGEGSAPGLVDSFG